MNKLTVKTVSLIFLLGMFATSCKDDDSFSSTPVAGGQSTIENLGSFSADLDGTNFSMVTTLANDIEPGVGSFESTDASVSPFVTNKDFSSDLTNTVSGDVSGVSVGSVTYSGSQLPSKSESLAIFSPGNKNYTRSLNNGVRVFVNIGGVTWSIANGSAD